MGYDWQVYERFKQIEVLAQHSIIDQDKERLLMLSCDTESVSAVSVTECPFGKSYESQGNRSKVMNANYALNQD